MKHGSSLTISSITWKDFSNTVRNAKLGRHVLKSIEKDNGTVLDIAFGRDDDETDMEPLAATECRNANGQFAAPPAY